MKYLTFFLLLITATSCIQLKPMPAPQFEGVKVNTVNNELIDVTVTLKIDNPNSFAIVVKKVNLDITAEGVKVGNVTFEDRVKIPANSVTSQEFRFKTPISQLGAAAIPLGISLLGKKEINVQADGSIRARALLISKNFPVHFANSVKLK